MYYRMLFDPSDCTSTAPFVKLLTFLTGRQRLKDDYLSMLWKFFSVPLGIGPNDRILPFYVVIRATMYLPLPGVGPMFSVFLGECVTH